ncbi:MAG TPA: S8 family serine peptidase [Candidatus Faecousia excrementipullorum]|nr:S8 family serine peptidase [Candidatus Faecousia excrementipullorum]
MKMKRVYAWLLALCMVFSMALTSVSAEEATEAPTEETGTQLVVEKLEGVESGLSLRLENGVSKEDFNISPEEEVRVIVVLEGESVVSADSGAVYNAQTAAQLSALESDQEEVIAQIEDTVLDGETLEVTQQFGWLVNGFAANIPYGKMSEIAALDGVSKVVLQTRYEPCSVEEGTLSPKTSSDGVMIGRENTWAQGYTGKGMTIAIIDSGLDTDHPNFAALPQDALNGNSMTESQLSGLVAGLNAAEMYTGLMTAENLYRSTKVPFAFNYGDKGLDVDHTGPYANEHGTHVAGIAAANQVEGSDVVGVAPDAQIAVMKVMDRDGYIYTSYWLAALEDALKLGCDMVNMSLGSPSGFTTSDDLTNEILGRVKSTGTVLCISAGNETTAGYGNAFGLNANLTTNPDNGVLGSPGSYANTMSVASVENVSVISDYISVGGSYNITYVDASNGQNPLFKTLAGQAYQVVAVPGTGTPEEFGEVNVEGKIALVQRGNISFTEKCENAKTAGAVACLVYNNEPGVIRMDLNDSKVDIPCASITMLSGAYILEQLAQNPNLTLEAGAEAGVVPSETAYQMSDFSSWGVTPSLTLEPDITAPGGNIYSTVDGGGYGVMSGTSMASPNLAGISALVKEYATSADGLGYADGAEVNALVRALLMSTSVPLVHPDGLYYSPRNQGSGLANAYNAVTTQAYLSVDGCDVPKVELYDDPGKVGEYNYSFQVHNFGDETLYYGLNTVAQTEGVNVVEGVNFMSSTPKALGAATAETASAMVYTHDVNGSSVCDSHDAYWIYQAVSGRALDENWTDVAFRYNTTADEEVTEDDVQAYLDALVGLESEADLEAQVLEVKAGETQTVNVSVNLSEDDRSYFAAYYPNGGYVEGYTFLDACNAQGIDLSLPYLGFYGNWTDAPLFDGDNANPETNGFFWGEENSFYNQYNTILWTSLGENDWIPGLNPYVDEAFDLSHVSLSPNEDGYLDNINDMYVSLLRNASELYFTYTNAQTGDVYHEDGIGHVPKTTLDANSGLCIPYVHGQYFKPYMLTDANGDYLPNNTKLTLTISGMLDYPGAPVVEKSVDITVDTEAPEVLGAQLQVIEGKTYLVMQFQDNVSVAAVIFLSRDGSKMIAAPADDAQAQVDEDGNLVWVQAYDLEQLTEEVGESFLFALSDYAMNETDLYQVTLQGDETQP